MANKYPSHYHAVPVWRFVWMSVATFGLYPFYWSYRQWSAIAERDRLRLWVSVRAQFHPLTFFALVSDINRSSEERGLRSLSILWPVLHLLTFVSIDRPGLRELGYIQGLGFLAIVPACKRMYDMSTDAEREARAQFRARHVIVSVIGVALWAFILSKMLGPPR